MRLDLKCKIENINSYNKYKYVVILSNYKGNWILSKHKERNTWEHQGGHIEENETSKYFYEKLEYKNIGGFTFQNDPYEIMLSKGLE